MYTSLFLRPATFRNICHWSPNEILAFGYKNHFHKLGSLNNVVHRHKQRYGVITAKDLSVQWDLLCAVPPLADVKASFTVQVTYVGTEGKRRLTDVV